MADNFINLSVLGKTYTFKTDADHHFAQKAADNLIEEIEKARDILAHDSVNYSQTIIILLAALNLAGENLIMEDHINFIRNRAKELLNVLE